jgi:hypothetical protein
MLWLVQESDPWHVRWIRNDLHVCSSSRSISCTVWNLGVAEVCWVACLCLVMRVDKWLIVNFINTFWNYVCVARVTNIPERTWVRTRKQVLVYIAEVLQLFFLLGSWLWFVDITSQLLMYQHYIFIANNTFPYIFFSLLDDDSVLRWANFPIFRRRCFRLPNRKPALDYCLVTVLSPKN